MTTRREILQQSGMGVGWLGLGALLASQGELVGAPRFNPAEPLSPKLPPLPAKAKRVIHIFMNGGPSQVDTFAPKPELEKWAGKTLPIH